MARNAPGTASGTAVEPPSPASSRHHYDLGRDAGEVEIQAYLYEALHLSRLQRNVLDRAAHDLITY